MRRMNEMMVTRRTVATGTAALALTAFGVSVPAARARQTDATPTVPGAGLGGSLVVYSGRAEGYIGELAERFKQATGIAIEMRYGPASELAATILEEGNKSPADLFLSLEAASISALAAEDLLAELPESILSLIDERFHAENNTWIGTQARVRTLAYNTENVDPATLPASVFDLTDEAWADQIGWAPQNASFLVFVTAMRSVHGDEKTVEWLTGMVENGTVVFDGNGAIIKAVSAGEISAGLVNHYYAFEIAEEEGEIPVANHYFDGADVGSLVNLAGAGVLKTAKNRAQAEAFIAFLLTEDAQTWIATEKSEYPVLEGVETLPGLKPLAEIPGPDVPPSDLADLPGTLALLTELGII
jgi:iron(III) transport system substrate-binding protein